MTQPLPAGLPVLPIPQTKHSNANTKPAMQYQKVAGCCPSLGFAGFMAPLSSLMTRRNCNPFLKRDEDEHTSHAWSRKGMTWGLRTWMASHSSSWFITMKASFFVPFGIVGRSLAPPFFSLPFSALPTGGGI